MTEAGAGASVLFIAILLPLGLALGIYLTPFRDRIVRVAWTASLPALAVAVAADTFASTNVPWLLLGVRLSAPDPLARALLLSTALLWSAAGTFARSYIADTERRHSFWFFFLLTESGNFGVLLAQDVVTFYVAYSVMTLAAYGTILYDRTEEARRAGRVYVVMAVAAEAILLAALWMLVRERVDIPLSEATLAAARTPHRDLGLVLLFVGFGIKAGVLPLHVWLPLAHPVAPAPASAILSGALIKAGLFGWIRFLPVGVVALPSHGAVLIVVGIVTMLYAAVVGTLQSEPKTVLAYSSISQMGFMLVPLGVALGSPSAAGMATSAAILFAQQHALAKGALFLGTAVASATTANRSRRRVAGGLVVSALAIAGGPFTGGALAKLSVKHVTSVSSHADLLAAALSVGSVGSTLLMARFLDGVLRSRVNDGVTTSAPRALWGPWAVLVGLGSAFPLYAWSRGVSLRAFVQAKDLWSATWPVVVGAAVAAAVLAAVRRGARLPTVPAGDVLVPIEVCVGRVKANVSLGRASESWKVVRRRSAIFARSILRVLGRVDEPEARLRNLSTIGILALLLVLASSLAAECDRSVVPREPFW